MTFQEYAEQIARQQIQEIENSDPKKVAFRHLASIDNSLKRIADALEAANSSKSGKANDHTGKIEISPGVLLPITE